jgi:hypothetical protein
MKNNSEFYKALEVLKDDKLKKARVVVIKTVIQEYKSLNSINPEQARRDVEELNRIFLNFKKSTRSSTTMIFESKDFEEYKGNIRTLAYQLVENSTISDQAKESFLSVILPAIFTLIDSFVNDDIMEILYEEIPEVIEGFVETKNGSYEERES